MSFLSGLLSVVGIAAAVLLPGPLGLIAGGLLATSFAAQQGWLGGSLKNFFSSGVGQGLTAAISLATAGASIANDISAVAPDAGAATASAGADASVASTAAGASPLSTGAGSLAYGTDAGAAATPGGFLADNGTSINGYISGLQSSLDPGETADGLPPASIAAANSAADTAAQQAGMSAAGAPPGSITNESASNLGTNTNPATTAAQNTNAATQAVNPTSTPQATAGASAQTPSQMAQTGPGGLQGAPAATPPASGGGSGISNFLTSAGKAIEAHPTLAVLGGQTLAGLAQGASQQKQLQEMLAAQQWGNEQWTSPQQLSQLQGAAATPITVPSGYLQRAQAVKNLMTGGSSQTGPVTGIQPTPSANVPNPNVAPTPTVAPLGMTQPLRGGM